MLLILLVVLLLPTMVWLKQEFQIIKGIISGEVFRPNYRKTWLLMLP